MTMRVFIGIGLKPTPPLRQLFKDMSRLKQVRPVEMQNLHLTLRFLGPIEQPQVDEVSMALDQAVTGITPFSIRAIGLGAFPNVNRPAVIWTRLIGAEPAGDIANALNDVLSYLGFQPPDRPWQAHLTVARVKDRPPRALFALLEQHERTEFGRWDVDAVQLVESQLSPIGPHYEVLYETRLVPSEPHDTPQGDVEQP